MEAFQAVGYHLINSTEIQDYTTRIYHGSIPETDNNYPVINYFMVSQPDVADGAAERPRFQISCRAKNAGTVMLMADKVKSIFNEIQDSIGGFDVQNTHYDNRTFIIEPDNVFHIPVDVFITYTNY